MIEETTRERMHRFALLVWSVIGVLALVWLLIRIAESIRIIWLPLAFAAGLVFLLNPLVNYFESRRIPRVVGAFLAFAFFVAVIVAGFSLLVPAIRTQAEAFASSLPETYDVVLTWIDDVAERFNLQVDLTQGAIAEWLAGALDEREQQLAG